MSTSLILYALAIILLVAVFVAQIASKNSDRFWKDYAIGLFSGYAAGGVMLLLYLLTQ